MEDGDKPSAGLSGSRKDFGGRSEQYRFANKQQIAVYKMAQKPTPQNKVLEDIRLEVVEQKGIHKATLIATDGYKLIRREVDAERPRRESLLNEYSIERSRCHDKVMKTTLMSVCS